MTLRSLRPSALRRHFSLSLRSQRIYGSMNAQKQKNVMNTNPADMYYGVLADRVRFFKESKEGVAVMCKVMEDMRKDSLKADKTA